MSGANELLKSRLEITEKQKEEYGFNFCERCNKSNQFRYEVHHIIYRSEAPKHPLLHNKINLTLVCSDCHNWYHSSKENRAKIVAERNLIELFK